MSYLVAILRRGDGVTDDERQAWMASRFIDYVELECRKHAGTARGELAKME